MTINKRERSRRVVIGNICNLIDGLVSVEEVILG
jgi:hypothetical protein